MLSTRQLRYFVEIAECGSFSAAAERLFIAQSALSRQIKDMEARLQTPLFERTARQPRLTAAGEALLPRARNLLNELSKASAMATEVGNGQLGTLRLSHSSTVSISGRLLRRISTYLNQQQGVSLDIGKLSSEAQLEELAEGRLDIGLLRLPVLRQREGIQVVPLFTERLLLAVPNDHRLVGFSRCRIGATEGRAIYLDSASAAWRAQLSVCRPVHASGLFPQIGAGDVAKDYAVAVDPGWIRHRPTAGINAGDCSSRRTISAAERSRLPKHRRPRLSPESHATDSTLHPDLHPPPAGAAEGCDLLILISKKPDQKIAASFHSTAPTGIVQ